MFNQESKMKENSLSRFLILVLIFVFLFLFSDRAVKSSSPAPTICATGFVKTRGEFFLVDPASGKVILYRMSYSSPDKANFQVLGITDYKQDIRIHSTLSK
jgi:signal peptidase I